MRILLDTHVFIWLNDAPEKLSDKARKLCENPVNSLFLSHVSPWEIQIKHQLGKLEMNISLREMIETQQNDNGLMLLPIELKHIDALSNFPLHHCDPFDRLLIAQASVEKLTLVSADQCFIDYSIDLAW